MPADDPLTLATSTVTSADTEEDPTGGVITSDGDGSADEAGSTRGATDESGPVEPTSSDDGSGSTTIGSSDEDTGPAPVEGTLIELGQPPDDAEAAWTCTEAIEELATDGLPLTVRITWTGPFAGFGHRLGAGCVGDGDPETIDLVLESNADGVTRGPTEDAVRVMNVGDAVRDLVITGNGDCGPKTNPATHQDGVQVLGGLNLTFRDFEVGFYDDGMSTCQGAGGAFFYSLPSTNTRVEGGRYIACNHSLLAGTGAGHVEGASFRSGRNDGSDPVCAYASSDPCLFQTGDVTSGDDNVCERWADGEWQP